MKKALSILILLLALRCFGSGLEHALLLQGNLVAASGLLNGLVSYWKLDEAANTSTRVDSQGANNLSDGSVVGAGASIINNGAVFLLNSAGLQCSSTAQLAAGSGQSRSFGLWFATTSLVFTQTILSKWDDAGPHREYILYLNSGVLTFTVRNLTDSANVTVTSTVTITAADYMRYVAFGYDDVNQVIWIKCESESRQTTSCTGIRSDTTQFRLGSCVDLGGSGPQGLDGVIDEAAVWDRVLTDAEVGALAAVYSISGIQSGISAGTDNANRWAAQVVSNGGSSPTTGTKTNFAAFVDGCVVDGVYYFVDHWNGLFNDSLTEALTPWYRSPGGNQPWVNHNFVSGDLTVNGITGNGSTKYLDTGVLPVNFPGQSVGLSLYIYNNVNEAKLDFGCQWNSGNNDLELYAPRSGDGGFFAAWSETGNGLVIGTVPHLFQGFVSGSRTAGNSAAMYYASSAQVFTGGGTQTGSSTSTSSGAGSTTIYLFNENFGGSPFSSLYSSKTYSFVVIHLGMTSGQTQSLYNRVQACLVAKGGGYR